MIARNVFSILAAVLAILVGFYPSVYFFVDEKFGLLQSKSDAVLSSFIWNIGFYTHIVLGGLALLTGWSQFNKKIRTKKLRLHRLLGKIYVVSVFLSAIAGFYIAFFATSGIIASVGFIMLALLWFYTTLRAYMYIRNLNIDKHQEMMIYSYALCFAAVTLRIWLPLLTMLFHDFTPAYRIVAYLCWVPNLIVAYLLVKQLRKERAAGNKENIAISNI